MAITAERIRQIADEPSLFEFLRDELNWPLPEALAAFDFYPDELDLLAANAARIERVSQIPNFEKAQPFGIFLIQFREKISRTALRNVLRGLSESRRNRDASLPAWKAPNLLFLCTANYQDFTIARFEGATHTRAVLSVFGWDREDAALRTLCEFNLPALRYPAQSADTGTWERQWASAFDVEKVSKRFYEEYKDVFTQVERQITGIQGDRRLFTQRLFNRLMFIQFLSKKKWLRFNGSADYLPTLYQAAVAKGENFYRERLYWLFFHGLGTLADNREAHNLEALREKRGDVPYLNGGLFEMMDSDDAQGAVEIPNAAFSLILTRLFARFNFTIHESTPLDVEVAVDPEMLGKVFEELVTGRHESGSYYTPRGIVAFMCREALKGYLGGYETLVDARDASGVSVPQAKELLGKLRLIKVVDPACGSGAYLLGMLHELHELTRLLDTRADQASARDDYQRKLVIIQSNLYGVDKDEFAVNIARLRLWLALAVEYTGETPQPLPNLDFKIECGDSLTAPDPSANAAQVDARSNLIAEFRKAKSDYADPYYPGRKSELRAKIEELRQDIAGWTHAGKTVQGFDWCVEFAEVFEAQEPETTLGGAMNFGQELAEAAIPGGFDVVLANPPYVRQELIKEQKPALKAIYPAVFAGTADLYCFFYARALQLLRPGGMLAFISPNKWFKAGYGANLRKHIAETCRVVSITDFGELPVFQAAATFPMIFVAQLDKQNTNTPPLFTSVKSLALPYPDVLALVRRDGQPLPANALRGSDWTLTDSASSDRLRKMEKAGVPLSEYVNGQIYRGVLTGFNTAFVITGAKRAELIAADPKSAEIIKPLAVGDDIRRWRIESKDKWLIVTKIGVDMKRYPAIFTHLCQWQMELEKRYDKGNHWWELRGCAYYDVFEEPKIAFPDIAKEPRFTIDFSGAYLGNTVYFLSAADLCLLGILNSQVVWSFCKERLTVLGDAEKGGRLRFFRQFVEKIPIPSVSDADKAAITALVQKCLDAKGVGCETWEREIDERVAALYGL